MKYLIWDGGIFVEQAAGLWRSPKDAVYYYTPYPLFSPKYEMYAVGKNFDHLTKELYFFDKVDEVDCIACFDVAGNDMLGYLREKYPNKSVFGSGRGKVLENDRWLLKRTLREIGLQVQKCAKVIGITALRNYIKTHPDSYVKINIFRGDLESFYAKDYKSCEMIFDHIESSLGPHKETFDFIVEKAIHTDVEIGCDLFFNGEDYIKPYIYGYEIHKNMYIGRVSEELPSMLKETMDKFRPVLKKYDWRGAVSTEEKIVSEKEHYFLDICARLPAPLSACYPQFIENWAELVYKIGKKETVKAQIKYKYLGTFSFESQYADEEWVRIELDKKNRDKVKLYSACVGKDGGYFSSKNGETMIVTLVAAGNTVDEVLSGLKEASKHVDAYGMNKDGINSLNIVKSVIKKGQSVGIQF